MSKNIKICIAVTSSLVLLFGAFMYNEHYKSTQKEISAVTFEINYVTEQIRQSTENDEEITLLDSVATIDFTTFQYGLLEEDQINFYIKLGENEAVELSNINMGTETSIGYVDDLEVMKKELTFVYKVQGYEEFLNFFNEVKSTKEYPASIETFSMSISEEDVVSGQMRLNQYYYGFEISSFEPYDDIEIGTTKVFRNE